MNIAERIDAALAYAIAEKRLTNEADWTAKAKVTPSYFQVFKGGFADGTRKSLRGAEAIRVAKAAGVNVDWLLTGDGPMIDGSAPPVVEAAISPPPVDDARESLLQFHARVGENLPHELSLALTKISAGSVDVYTLAACKDAVQSSYGGINKHDWQSWEASIRKAAQVKKAIDAGVSPKEVGVMLLDDEDR